MIYDHEEEEIKDELILKKKNSWIQDDLDSIFKFPNSSTLKVTISQTILAKKCTEKGLRAFNISIPAHEIKQETFIPVNCCMRCYNLEDHATRDCHKDSRYKLCSECSIEGHLWHECKEKTKKCVNCKEKHSTMAMRCPKRKIILKEKRREETERKNMNYVEIVRSQGNVPTQSSVPHYIYPDITKEETLKIHICVAHARYNNLEKLGSSGDELNKILTANNLPNQIIPDCPKSDKIFTTETQGSAQYQTTTHKSRNRGKKQRKDSTNTQTTESEASDLEHENIDKGTDVKDATDFGLKLYTAQ